MNKLDLYPNGHPLLIEDLQHMQAGYSEAIKGIVQSFYDVANYPDHAIILSGCETTSVTATTTINVAEGYVAFKGEVFYVPPHSFSTTGFVRSNDFQFELLETQSGVQPVAYASAANHYTRKVREMRMFHIQTGTTASVYSVGVFKDIHQALATKNVIDWEYIANDNLRFLAPSYLSFMGGNEILILGSAPIRIKKSTAGTIMIQGHFVTNHGNTSIIGKRLFTMPIDYRPAQDFIFNFANGTLRIQSGSGDVSITASTNEAFSLDGIVFTND